MFVNLCTLTEILSNPWQNTGKVYFNKPNRFKKVEILNLHTVQLWELIYFKSGVIGVYAAWQPYAEFYIITHNFHLHENFIEQFTEADTVIKRCEELGILLEPLIDFC